MTLHAAPRLTRFDSLPALEEAVRSGLLRGWEGLLQHDLHASFFQGPTWTLCWYRAYAQRFEPLVLVLAVGDALVGLAPMAVERRSGRLAFAGDHMADYRDVVALPGHRERMIRELVRLYQHSEPRTTLRFGSTLPESASPAIVTAVCREEGVPCVPLTHHGWRWWPEEAQGDPFRSRSARYKLNRIKRRGEVSVATIGSDEWPTWRRDYFDQHSLRQISRGTDVSFGRPEKRRFFDALVQTPLAHVTALRAGGSAIAWHYGCLDRGVLYLGAPAFDVREHRQSPALLLILLLMQQAAELGIRGVDLTIGEGDLKERHSTSRVVLPTIELFPHQPARLRRHVAHGAAAALRRALSRVGREQVWTGTIRPAGVRVFERLSDARTMPPRLALRYLTETLATPLVERSGTAVFAQGADAAAPPPEPGRSATITVERNETRDFLRFDYDDRYALHRVRGGLNAIADAPESADLHTMVADGRLVAWVMSARTGQAMPADADGLALPAGTAVLWAAGAVHDTPAELAALLRQVAAERRGEGAGQVSLLARRPGPALRRAAALAGFLPRDAGAPHRSGTVPAPVAAGSEPSR